MESMVRQLRNGSEKGVAQQDVIVEANGVRGLIRADAGDTGFIFLFKVIGKSDSPCSNSWALKKKLDSMATRYPAEQFFFKFKVWNNPEDFQAISDIRKYLTDKGYEVGWIPHSSREDDEVDLILGVGIYNESFSSIKAQ